MSFPIGTRSPQTPSAYTDEQYAALEALKQPGLKLGAARAEFAGKLLLADGTLSDDTAGMLAAAAAFDQGVMRRRTELVARIRAEAPGTDTTAIERAVSESIQGGRRVAEATAALATNWFLFVVDGCGVPVIYFPCYGVGNPAVEQTTNGVTSVVGRLRRYITTTFFGKD